MAAYVDRHVFPITINGIDAVERPNLTSKQQTRNTTITVEDLTKPQGKRREEQTLSLMVLLTQYHCLDIALPSERFG
jgi:hypothetical protein